jgi:hypothetical protein
MSKKSQHPIVRHVSKRLNHWDEAICDAKKEIQMSIQRIAGLKKAICAFKAMRDAGEPWPETFGSESGDLGQDEDLGQSPLVV